MGNVKRALEKVEDALNELGDVISCEDVDKLKSEGVLFQDNDPDHSCPKWLVKIIPEPWQDVFIE